MYKNLFQVANRKGWIEFSLYGLGAILEVVASKIKILFFLRNTQQIS